MCKMKTNNSMISPNSNLIDSTACKNICSRQSCALLDGPAVCLTKMPELGSHSLIGPNLEKDNQAKSFVTHLVIGAQAFDFQVWSVVAGQ